MLPLILTFLAFTATTEAIFSTGKCFEVPPIPNFNVNAYIGSWYQIRRFNSVFERQLKCGRAIYYRESDAIVVENIGLNKITGELARVPGIATVIDSAAPNKLSLELLVEVGGDILRENEYSIWDTDYINYALIYSCKQIDSQAMIKAETVWILGRQRALDDYTVKMLSGKLAADGFDMSKLEVVDQKACD